MILGQAFLMPLLQGITRKFLYCIDEHYLFQTSISKPICFHQWFFSCGGIVGNKLCIVGGKDGGTVGSKGWGWDEVPQTDCYDLDSGTWSVEADIPLLRSGPNCGTTCDGKLMVAGGADFGQEYAQVDVFDGKTWTTLGSLNVGRHGSGLAIDCVCNQIHLAGGSAGPFGNTNTPVLETYFPQGFIVPCEK